MTPARLATIKAIALLAVMEARAAQPRSTAPTEHGPEEDCHGLCGAEDCMRKAAKEEGLPWPE